MIRKKYFYDYEDYEEGGKDGNTLIQDILNDKEFITLEEIIIGCWGESWDESSQVILDTIVKEKEKFQHIRSLFIGDMTYEECEVSWIIQGDYSELWSALPKLEKLTIKGSEGLILGNINHSNLKSLEIICGGLPKSVIDEICKAKLPNLESLNLYIGVDNYGFDGDITDIGKIIAHLPSFKNLTYLGIGNSDIQDDIVEKILQSEIIEKLKVLDFSNGTLSDKGGNLLLQNKGRLKNLQKLDLHHHFLSNEMMNELSKIGIEIDLSEQNEDDKRYGNYPMLTE